LFQLLALPKERFEMLVTVKTNVLDFGELVKSGSKHIFKNEVVLADLLERGLAEPVEKPKPKEKPKESPSAVNARYKVKAKKKVKK